MYSLDIKPTFEKSFSNIKDKITRKQIWNKIQHLKVRAPIGKKLVGNPYWSLRVGVYRIIYYINEKDKIIEILNVISRKFDYRGL